MALEATVFGDKSTYDVLIIGSGPAGLTAAIYARNANLKTGYIEKDVPGGKLVNIKSITNYPGYKQISGVDLALTIYEQANDLGAEYIYGKVTQIVPKLNYLAVYTEDGMTRYTKVCIVATGVSETKLAIPGAEQLSNKGISYCAVCDGTLAKQKDVMIYGSGQEAINNAIYLSAIASKIYLVNPHDKFDGNTNELKSLANVEILMNSSIQNVNGIDQLESVVINNKTFPIHYLFVCIGHHIANEILTDHSLINPDGTIKINDRKQTLVPGLFAIGDVTKTTYRQIATATNDGVIAALNAIKYIKEE
jgi:thioredoxin reductase (NADPH)